MEDSSPMQSKELPMTEADANKYTGDGSVDYKGRPAERTKSGTWMGVPFLFVMVCLDMMANYSVVLNLQIYLIEKLFLTAPEASQTTNNVMGTSFLCPLLGGFFADAYLGRFTGGIVFGLVQMIGSFLLTIASADGKLKRKDRHHANRTQLAVHFLALYTMAVGSGGMRPCLSALGADQFDETDPKEKTLIPAYFTWSFFFGVSGVLFSITLLVWVQDKNGFTTGYAIATILLFMGLVVVSVGSPFYRYQRPRGSPLTRIAQVFVASVRKRKLSDGELYEIPHLATSKLEILPHTRQFKWLDRAAMISSPFNLGDNGEGTEASIPSAWNLCTVTQVEEAKILVRMIPIMLTTILLSTCAAQFPTWMILQGMTMHRKLGDFVIPPPSIGALAVVAMVLAIPLYDRFFVPLARRFTGSRKGISPLVRTGAGLMLATLSMFIGGFVEGQRRQIALEHQLVDVDPTKPSNALPMQIYWLVPMQVTFLLGEFLATVGLTEFFYSEAPRGMRTLVVGVSASTTGVGFYLSSALISAVNSFTKRHGGMWLPDNINHGHLDYFYFLLFCLGSLNFILFLLASRWYSHQADMSHRDTGNLNSATKTGHLVEVIPLERMEPEAVPGFQPVQAIPLERMEPEAVPGFQPVQASERLQATAEQTWSPPRTGIGSPNVSSPARSVEANGESNEAGKEGQGNRLSLGVSRPLSIERLPSRPSPTRSLSFEANGEYYAAGKEGQGRRVAFGQSSPLRREGVPRRLSPATSPSMKSSSILRARLKEVFKSEEFMDSPKSAFMEQTGNRQQTELLDSPSESRRGALHEFLRGTRVTDSPARVTPADEDQKDNPDVTRFKAPDVWSSDDEGVSLTDFSFIREHFKRFNDIDSVVQRSSSLEGMPP